jgi:hypothetical protein
MNPRAKVLWDEITAEAGEQLSSQLGHAVRAYLEGHRAEALAEMNAVLAQFEMKISDAADLFAEPEQQP